MCSADLLSGSAVHVHVHRDSDLPVHTEEEEAKRSAAFQSSLLVTLFDIAVFFFLSMISSFSNNSPILSLQTITTWSKAHKTGKGLRASHQKSTKL